MYSRVITHTILTKYIYMYSVMYVNTIKCVENDWLDKTGVFVCIYLKIDMKLKN